MLSFKKRDKWSFLPLVRVRREASFPCRYTNAKFAKLYHSRTSEPRPPTRFEYITTLELFQQTPITELLALGKK